VLEQKPIDAVPESVGDISLPQRNIAAPQYRASADARSPSFGEALDETELRVDEKAELLSSTP
jgi:hypothetical protein